eukprot:NODE_404_length_1405_cov_92.581858_g298_i0.p1 GENE.NODE_404_length_1405_cov_92.581858_g298_i0~~NODE_404_length_1405_cov_92.581858_g298_i0.p1  ORF type:complete len:298 (+),score=110.19 NODE_404_length_1405_cov_92.581858_g298_i0:90-983(+)
MAPTTEAATLQHEPGRVPRFLATADGSFVLADAREVYLDGQHCLDRDHKTRQTQRQNLFPKGECSLRRQTARALRLAQALAAHPHYKRLLHFTSKKPANTSLGLTDISVEAIQQALVAQREKEEEEQAARSEAERQERRRVPKGPAPQCIKDFMHQPRTYNAISLDPFEQDRPQRKVLYARPAASSSAMAMADSVATTMLYSADEQVGSRTATPTPAPRHGHDNPVAGQPVPHRQSCKRRSSRTILNPSPENALAALATMPGRQTMDHAALKRPTTRQELRTIRKLNADVSALRLRT